MRYKNLEKARAKRTAKEAEKENKKAKKVLSAVLTAKEATVGTGNCGKRKCRAKIDVPKPKAKMARISETQVKGSDIASEQYKASVTRMW